MAVAERRTRILIVDDSAIVRRMLADALNHEPDMEVIGRAADPFAARDLILLHDPDVVTLDLEMPRMDGLTFLRELMQHHPLPVIIISSVTQSGSAAGVEALAAGALDVIGKPGGPCSVVQVAERLKRRIRALRAGHPVRLARTAPRPAVPSAPVVSLTDANGIVLIGASTGGTQAIEAVLTRLPADTPPILVVQHMPPRFTRAFAARLDSVCPMHVVEAQRDDALRRGVVYVAPGDFHLEIESAAGATLRVHLHSGPPVHFQRPAVDVLFHSAAKLRGVPVVALLLTGMGADGADGLVALRQAGATTIAESEESCVVFGMPARAIARGAAMHVAALPSMPQLIADAFNGTARGDVTAAGGQPPAVRRASWSFSF